MKCPACAGNKFYYEKIIAYYDVSAPKKCTNPNCIGGRHIKGWSHHYSEDLKSYKDIHGRENKLLCKKCKGQGCSDCYNTGFVTYQCRKCKGYGYITRNYSYSDKFYRKKPCVACRDGKESKKGSLGEILEEHYNET